MSKQVSIGGDRLGSGKKMKTNLNDYGRSTHNLSENWRSSMAPGVLTPFMCKIGLNGDVFDIDLQAMARTIPTQGPLFGTFKLQMDVFCAPIRLYQGILHNNPMNIGLNMKQVLLPQLQLTHNVRSDYQVSQQYDLSQISSNCLLKYLGISGIGKAVSGSGGNNVGRYFNAVPPIAYFDIVKTYYANKQEKNAYIVSAEPEINSAAWDKVILFNGTDITKVYNIEEPNVVNINEALWPNSNSISIVGQNLSVNSIALDNGESQQTLEYWEREEKIVITVRTNTEIRFRLKMEIPQGDCRLSDYQEGVTTSDIVLKAFPLENIDKMRRDLLKVNDFNERYIIEPNTAYYPYKALVERTSHGINYNAFNMNGLALKTYQSDIFNNWIQTEWIDGDNGISEITAVDVSDGYFTIDQLNLASKIYKMFNRIAVTDGTYESWQEAVYGIDALRHAESPIYCGGMSSEIAFSEVVQTADSNVSGDDKKTGSLAGKGTLVGNRGGHVHIKVKEPSIIMGIVSITPRVDYTQGNEWYMTDLETIDDLHKPALDGIGFQDLLEEQAAWFGTTMRTTTGDISAIVERHAIGKVPAWMNYMTSVNKAYGDFIEDSKAKYMILARNYETDPTDVDGVKDMTTYIDPTKFNYAFAYTKLDAQNFWIQIYSKIEARRIMSAKIIPNL